MASSALLIRCLGMTFRVFLVNTIGAEGVGLYQLIMSLYLFFASASTAGITLCATRLFGDLYAKGKPGQARYAVERCMVIALLTGAVLGGLMFVLSEPCALWVLHEEGAAPALRLLAPSLPFMAASACVRGYFTARRKTLPTCMEQVLEQLIEMGVLAAVFALQPPQNTGDACCRAVLGTSMAELLSFFYSLCCYRIDSNRLHCRKERLPSLWKRLLPVAAPVTANACLRSGLSAAENALIPRGLEKYGYQSRAALTQYGIISGMSMTVLVFPSVLILPFAVLIIPEIADAAVLHNRREIRHISGRMLHLTMLYSLPITVVLLFHGIPLCRLLFGNEQAGVYLSVLAPVIPLMYLDSVVDGILKGLNEQTSYLIFNTVDSVLRVILTCVLLPLFGIWGVIAVIIISELLNTLMSLFRLLRVTSLRLSLRNSLFLPLLCILLPCCLLRLLPLADWLKLPIEAGGYLLLLKLTKKTPELSPR